MRLNRSTVLRSMLEESVSKKVLEGLGEDEERDDDHYDMVVMSIDKFGDRYFVLQSIERSKNLASGFVEE